MPGPFRILLLARDSVDRTTAAELIGATDGDVRVTSIGDALSFAGAFADGTSDLVIVSDDLGWAGALEMAEALRNRNAAVPIVLWMDPTDFDGAIAAFRAGCADVVARGSGSAIALRDAVVRSRTRAAPVPTGEKPLWTLLDTAGMATFRCGYDGTLLARGPALARLAGDAAARPGANLLGHLLSPERLEGVLATLARGEPVRESGLANDKDKGPWVDLTALQRDEEVWGILTDSTEIRRLRLENQHLRDAANTDTEDLALGLAHDLREPLRSLGIRLDAIEAALPDSAKDRSREALDAARHHISRLDEQIRTRLSSPGAGRQATEGTDCNAVFEQVRSNLAAAMAESEGVVNCDPLPTVSVPEAQMLQVLQNLVGNALRHRGDSAPVVHVTARRTDSAWQFTVRDNGPGIPPEHRDEAFQTRWRGPGSTGTGVGLAVCRTIVMGQGGRIWVDDVPQGGLAVSFTLPFADRAKIDESAVSLKVVGDS